ncbi:hypothetical protein [Streptomyces sp. NPDC059894]|uniref:hypothetical protein n=1 Tax=unclassified Streptomyces TaxID=2593676 RepID=UPI0036507491
MKRTIRMCLASAAFAGALFAGTATPTASAAPDTRAPSLPAPPASEGPFAAADTAVRPADDTSPRDGLDAQASPCWYASSHWWCNNVSGAGVYVNDNGTARLVGTMYSNPSWFVCRSDDGGHVGGPHPNRWEWTQADNGAWGWMKDTDIYSETDPLPVC